MLKRDITNASTADILDWLCYHCWREYNRACKKGEREKQRVYKEIGWMRDEILKRCSKPAETGS